MSLATVIKHNGVSAVPIFVKLFFAVIHSTTKFNDGDS